MIKKTLLLLLALTAVHTAARSETALKVTLTDGTASCYILDDKPVVSFSGTLMNIASLAASASFERSDVRSLSFTEDISSVINNLTDGMTETLRYTGNELQAPGRRIELYSINGRHVAGSDGTLSTAGLEKGIYVARAGRQTLKINIR